MPVRLASMRMGAANAIEWVLQNGGAACMPTVALTVPLNEACLTWLGHALDAGFMLNGPFPPGIHAAAALALAEKCLRKFY